MVFFRSSDLDLWLGSNRFLFGDWLVDERGDLRFDRSEGWHGLILGDVLLVLVFSFLVILGFRAGDGELAAHEELVVQDFNGALGFVNIDHLDKAVAFRAVSVAVVNDLHTTDCTDAFEEFLKVAFGHIVGEVANVNAAVLNAGRISTTWAVAIAFATAISAALVATW